MFRNVSYLFPIYICLSKSLNFQTRTFHDRIRPLLIAGFEEETQSLEMLKGRCNVRILMETIGGGFDKTVSGKVKRNDERMKVMEEDLDKILGSQQQQTTRRA